MQVIPIHDQQFLNDFVSRQRRSQFLQSWDWGEFQTVVGRTVHRFGVEDDGHLVAAAQIIEHKLPFELAYWYCPRGLIVADRLPVLEYQTVMKTLLDEIVDRAEAAHALFVRFEPSVEQSLRQIFLPFVQEFHMEAIAPVQPRDTLVIDCAKTEDELLAEMHEKTRYNVRLAERRGVTVRREPDPASHLPTFLQFNRQTTHRDRFVSHPDVYYQLMVQAFGPVGMLALYVAEFNRRAVAANLVIHFGDTATYLHGASSNLSRNLMAPYLLQWQQIKDAKAAGKKWYDFWGVAPGGENFLLKHPWSGLTRFKRGFGGSDLAYLGGFDLPLRRSWYRFYRMTRSIF